MRMIKREYTISGELKLVTLMWILCGSIINGVFIYRKEMAIDHETSILIAKYTLITRCVFLTMISVIPQIYQSYRGKIFIPIPPNKGCIETLDFVLNIPIATEYFYEYLDNQANSEPATFFTLYTDLRHYDKMCKDNE